MREAAKHPQTIKPPIPIIGGIRKHENFGKIKTDKSLLWIRKNEINIDDSCNFILLFYITFL